MERRTCETGRVFRFIQYILRKKRVQRRGGNWHAGDRPSIDIKYYTVKDFRELIFGRETRG